MDKSDELKPLSHWQLQAAHKKQKEAKEKKYSDRSKKRLSTIITKKIKTSFIGSIAAVEDGMGFLWGHDKKDSELTDDERAMKEIWEVVRAQILDNGNGQLRGAINELNNNSVHWDRYHVDIPVDNPDEETYLEKKKETE